MLQLTINGSRLLLDWAVRTTGTSLTVRLYRSEIAANLLLDPQVIQEANFTDYAPIELLRANWSQPVINRGQQAETNYAVQRQFSFGSQQIIHGAYVTDQQGLVMFIEPFLTPRQQAADSRLIFSPKMLLGDLGDGSVLVPQEGLLELANQLFRAVPTNQHFRLFSNNLQVSETSQVGDFQEASFTGYQHRLLQRTNWLSATNHSTNQSRIQYADDLTWSPTSDQTIYGYYVTNPDNTKVLWAHRFAEPLAIVSGSTLTQQVSLALLRS